MKKILRFGLVAVVALTVTSCTIAKISGKGVSPIMLNQPSEQMELMEHISVEKNINFDYTNSFDVSEVLADVLAQKKPDAVINTTVIIKTGVDNYFINMFTCGMAASKKVVIEADLMKKK